MATAFVEEDPVLLYVGRFTAVKRVSLLIEAYAQALPHFDRPAPLVLLGGFPGEWEGEHPLDAIRRTGVEDVYLAGWHGHDELPSFLAAADVVVLPSVREQFGQVLVEGMACGLPAIAVDAPRPGRDRPSRAHRAGCWSPTTATRWPPRWSRPSTSPTSGAAAARRPTRTCGRASRGPRSPSDVAAVYDEILENVRTVRDPGPHELV